MAASDAVAVTAGGSAVEVTGDSTVVAGGSVVVAIGTGAGVAGAGVGSGAVVGVGSTMIFLSLAMVPTFAIHLFFDSSTMMALGDIPDVVVQAGCARD